MKQSRPRVLLAGTFLSRRGGSRAPIEDLAERLAGAGYQTLSVSAYRNRYVRVAHLLSTAVARRRQYDVAVVDLYSGRGFLWGEALSIVLSALGRPFIISLHGGALPQFAKRHPERVHACLRRADAVTSPSEYLRDTMKGYRQDIQVLPNPLTLEIFPYRHRSRVNPDLLWVRGFHAMYNPWMAVEVVARLAPEFPETRLTMVGRERGDDSLARTQELARRLGVERRIQFPGAVARTDVPRWMSQADIFLNTTDIDNTPVSVLEAMACGMCVVTTDAGGIPYLVDSGRDAIVVPKKDAGAMCQAVERLLRAQVTAASLSAAARATAARFDWPIVFPHWLKLLDEVAGAGRTHAAAA